MFEPTARNIRDLRLVLGLNRAEFAQRLGVSVSTVSRWEVGQMKPRHLARRALEQLASNVVEQRKRPG